MTPNPTPAEFKARYPEFTGVTDALVSAIIAEVSPMVDDGWVAHDQKPAVMALAAHTLSREGYPDRLDPNGDGFDGSMGPILSRKVGDVSVTWGRADGGAAASSGSRYNYQSTVYGQTFLRLMRLNVPAVALV